MAWTIPKNGTGKPTSLSRVLWNRVNFWTAFVSRFHCIHLNWSCWSHPNFTWSCFLVNTLSLPRFCLLYYMHSIAFHRNFTYHLPHCQDSRLFRSRWDRYCAHNLEFTTFAFNKRAFQIGSLCRTMSLIIFWLSKTVEEVSPISFIWGHKTTQHSEILS